MQKSFNKLFIKKDKFIAEKIKDSLNLDDYENIRGINIALEIIMNNV